MSKEVSFVDRNDHLKATVRTENGQTKVTLEDLNSERVQELAPGSQGYQQIMQLAATINGQRPKDLFGPRTSIQETFENGRAMIQGDGLAVTYSDVENGRQVQGQMYIAGNLGNLRQ